MLKFHNSDLWIAWLVCFCVNVCVRSLEVTVSQSSVQVARGQAAILPCTFTTSAALNNLYIIWMVTPLANANQPEQVIIYQGGQVFSLANHMNGRVGFVSTMPSTSASIFINNTQLSDTGTYQCLVNNLPDRGGRNIGVIGLTVLVPPSIPSCRIQGLLDVGSDVMLLCGSDEGIPTPTYAWEKLESVPKLPHNAMQDQMQGTVTLRNISTSTSGLYQCTASNAIGKSTCVLNLQVVAPSEHRSDRRNHHHWHSGAHHLLFTGARHALLLEKQEQIRGGGDSQRDQGGRSPSEEILIGQSVPSGRLVFRERHADVHQHLQQPLLAQPQAQLRHQLLHTLQRRHAADLQQRKHAVR
ncbi:immunoglobulin superfamily member 11 isoform X2 [Sinocyclocheilus grahami]|uniref:immunoglobulin superfamily member 11 isoform X2 n=1 Tax=Sinocyclocheilus grahami TaxID=75366 RepID=UPI0007AD36F3|nr:PREDICTED: immunoglobulin superfamily member 11 isoform X2 [Sinocyclocheilus grahami]